MGRPCLGWRAGDVWEGQGPRYLALPQNSSQSPAALSAGW